MREGICGIFWLPAWGLRSFTERAANFLDFRTRLVEVSTDGSPLQPQADTPRVFIPPSPPESFFSQHSRDIDQLTAVFETNERVAILGSRYHGWPGGPTALVNATLHRCKDALAAVGGVFWIDLSVSDLLEEIATLAVRMGVGGRSSADDTLLSVSQYLRANPRAVVVYSGVRDLNLLRARVTENWSLLELGGRVIVTTPRSSIGPSDLPSFYLFHPIVPSPGRLAEDQPADPTGFSLQQVLYENSLVSRLAWSPDGSRLAASLQDGTIGLWNVENKKLRTLKRHITPVLALSWAPDGAVLASASDETISLWDTDSAKPIATLAGHAGDVNALAWSPDGRILASGADDGLRLWDGRSGQLALTLSVSGPAVTSVSWSPEGRVLASGSDDGLRLWEPTTGRLRSILGEPGNIVYGVIWFPDGRMLASSSADNTVRVWDADSGRQLSLLEGHTEAVTSITVTVDGRVLASKSRYGTVRLWRCDTWETVAILDEPEVWARHPGRVLLDVQPGLDFHPKSAVLATLGEAGKGVRIWELNFDALLDAAPTVDAVYYTNAKVVLLGDTGVGKSALSGALTGQPFAPTESTHARRVWTFEYVEVDLGDGRKEVRETLLWDLAGQPGYRLIHSLHLDDVAVALVVFDSRSEVDPFAGIHHWDRALRVAQRRGDWALPAKKLLVAARCDRGRVGISSARINSLVRELGFDGYFETSAAMGWGITELGNAIRSALDWQALPRVALNELLHSVMRFLIKEKETGRLLSTSDDLYRSFLDSDEAPAATRELRAQFESCIERLQASGLVRRLSFANFVLLQPELLDAYASALIDSAQEDPDGLGSIPEEDALYGRFRLAESERIKDRAQERLLLIATVEDLLANEIALRERTADGTYLIFPTGITRGRPDLPDAEGRTSILRFEGPVLQVFATLVVRLSHSGFFMKADMWKNAATYTTKAGGKYGLLLREIEEGTGELTLFFDSDADPQLRLQFESYIRSHLERHALLGSITERRIFTCPSCTTPLSDLAVIRRRERGYDWISCPVCATRISLLDRAYPTRDDVSAVLQMDRAADTEREQELAASTIAGKVATRNFDVLLCYNSADKRAVIKIAERLKERGILPWLDEWQQGPGLRWQSALEETIGKVNSVVVFIGSDSNVPWDDSVQVDVLTTSVIEQGIPIIPAILPDAGPSPRVGPVLRQFNWVDFRKNDPDPIDQLVWGITGHKPMRRSPL